MVVNIWRPLGACVMAFGMSACSVLSGLHVNVPEEPQGDLKYNFVPITPEVVRLQYAPPRVTAAAPDTHVVPLAGASPSPAPAPLGQAAADYRYRIGPGDVLTIIVWDHPELTSPAGPYVSPEVAGRLVSQDGTMFYPYLGVFKVAGLTLDEVRGFIAERLTRVIKTPQVDVRMATFRAHKVTVTGEVLQPGVFQLTDQPLGVLDALTARGGLTERASRSQATLTRDGTKYPIDVATLLAGGSSSAPNFLLHDGDILNFPDNSREKVFLLGEFAKQAPIPFDRGYMTLTEAITAGGGLNPATANRKALFVFRDETGAAPAGPADWRPTVYALDLSKAESVLLADQFQLKPRDVVYVAATSFAKYNTVINALLPTISSVFQINALYRATK